MHNRNFFEDVDPEETREWLEALESVLEQEGPERAGWLLETLTNEAQEQGVIRTHLDTPYLNTIRPKDEAPIPGDIYMERRIRSLVRWNALAMVIRANKDNDDELGGHIVHRLLIETGQVCKPRHRSGLPFRRAGRPDVMVSCQVDIDPPTRVDRSGLQGAQPAR